MLKVLDFQRAGGWCKTAETKTIPITPELGTERF